MRLDVFGTIIEYVKDDFCPLSELISQLGSDVMVRSNVSDRVHNLNPYHLQELIGKGILIASRGGGESLNPEHFVYPRDTIIICYALPDGYKRKNIDDYFVDVERNPWKKLL